MRGCPNFYETNFFFNFSTINSSFAISDIYFFYNFREYSIPTEKNLLVQQKNSVGHLNLALVLTTPKVHSYNSSSCRYLSNDHPSPLIFTASNQQETPSRKQIANMHTKHHNAGLTPTTSPIISDNQNIFDF